MKQVRQQFTSLLKDINGTQPSVEHCRDWCAQLASLCEAMAREAAGESVQLHMLASEFHTERKDRNDSRQIELVREYVEWVAKNGSKCDGDDDRAKRKRSTQRAIAAKCLSAILRRKALDADIDALIGGH